jgi:hypothetical protein
VGDLRQTPVRRPRSRAGLSLALHAPGAISNSRLLAINERGVSLRWKDYRAKGRTRYKAMTLSLEEFMRRFLLHVRLAASIASGPPCRQGDIGRADSRALAPDTPPACLLRTYP